MRWRCEKRFDGKAKKEKYDDIKLEELEMFHRECYGGKLKKESYQAHIEYQNDYNNWGWKAQPVLELSCIRCQEIIRIPTIPETTSNIIKTSITGLKNKTDGFIGEKAVVQGVIRFHRAFHRQDGVSPQRKKQYNRVVKFLNEKLKPKIFEKAEMANGDLMEDRLLPPEVKFNEEKQMFE